MIEQDKTSGDPLESHGRGERRLDQNGLRLAPFRIQSVRFTETGVRFTCCIPTVFLLQWDRSDSVEIYAISALQEEVT